MDRIESAWERCRSWIATRDGSAREACFTEVPRAKLCATLDSLRSDSISFALSPTWLDLPGDRPDSPEETVALLDAEQLANFIVSVVTEAPGNPIELQIVVERTGPGRFEANAIWWPDQVFAGPDDRASFGSFLGFLLGLQVELGARGLLLGPGNTGGPREAGSAWCEL